MPGRLLGHLSPAVDMDHIKRPSLSGLTSRRHPSKDRSSEHAAKGKQKQPDSALSVQKGNASHTPSSTGKPAKTANIMSIAIESPPNIFFGVPAQSTGALFSGQLRIQITEPDTSLHTFTMQLLATIKARKPVSKDCPDCAQKTTELFKWTFLTEPKALSVGTHSFPFSYLLPGHLPATTHGILGDLEYYLDARATTLPTPAKPAEEITLRHSLHLSRALMPAPEKNSLRVFPPTNLTAHVTMTPTIYPIGESNVLMKLGGVTEKHEDHQQRWRLRKMSWRLEETEKMISPACPKHAHKVGGEGRGIAHEDVRSLGQMELKEGWKSDFSEGTIEMEFSIRAAGHVRPLCDVDSPTGLSISHSLVVELVVAEEWAWAKKPGVATPSGAARVLRAQFQVIVTERAGLGISWDEEQPPMYEDVPDSPPLYPQLESGNAPAAGAAKALAASSNLGSMTPTGMDSGVNTAGRAPTGREGVLEHYDGPPLYSPSVVPQAVPLNMTSMGEALPGDDELENFDLNESLRRPGPPAGH